MKGDDKRGKKKRGKGENRGPIEGERNKEEGRRGGEGKKKRGKGGEEEEGVWGDFLCVS